jgi:hypothetical protein
MIPKSREPGMFFELSGRYLVDPESKTEDLDNDLGLLVDVVATLSDVVTRDPAVGHAAAWFASMARGLRNELEGRRMLERGARSNAGG